MIQACSSPTASTMPGKPIGIMVSASRSFDPGRRTRWVSTAMKAHSTMVTVAPTEAMNRLLTMARWAAG